MAETYQRGKVRQRRERAIRIFFFCVALASITTLTLIVIFLFMEGLPIFAKVSVKDFIFGKYWYPTDDPADFGIFPLIVASLSVTAVASLISIPLGVMTALYLAEVAFGCPSFRGDRIFRHGDCGAFSSRGF
jgi:phosphate transport system permease protein